MKIKSAIAAILLIALTLPIFTPILIRSSTTAESLATAMHKNEDIFEGSFSSREVAPAPNEVFDVSFSICPTMDAPSTVIRFIVPANLIRLEKGDKVWTGDVAKGETVTLTLSFATDGEAEAYVRADVEAAPSGKNYRSSYYLHVATPTAQLAGEKGGELRSVDVEAEIPAGSDPESSRALVNPENPGNIRIYGTFLYVNEGGGYSPARYMLVQIWDEDTLGDEYVTGQWTDGDGKFDITCNNDDGFLQDGRDPYVVLCAEGEWDWFTKNSGGTRYEWRTERLGQDVPDNWTKDVGTRAPTSNNEALQAGDACYAEAQWIYDRVGWMRPTKVDIRWPKEDWPHCHGDSIHLPSKSTASWDHVTVHHEYAHSVMWDLYGNSWPPGTVGGTHWVYMEDVLPDAYVEGWAEFMECAVDNNPNNLQSVGHNIETNDWYNHQDTGSMDGAYVEGEVASILWDILDPTGTESGWDRFVTAVTWTDSMAWGFDEIFWIIHDHYSSIANIEHFWTQWVAHYSTLSTSVGPLCTIYWNYGIDHDIYAPYDGSISINAGAAYTTSRTVTLTLSCKDWGSGVKQMRFSNDIGDTWSAWVAYATTYSYYMANPGDGLKYVDVQFKDYNGYVSTYLGVYDSIVLDTTAPIGSIVINSGNPTYTTTTSVTLYLTYSDATSGVDKVRYSNDGSSWTAWETPAATRAWTLTSGDGTKTVYYQIRDKAGWISISYTDTIILDTTGPTGSIVINSGNPTYTTSTSVTLHLTYSDAASGVDKVRYSNDGVWDTEPWEIPSATKAWTLTSGDGTKTVYYQIRDKVGYLSLTYSDTITLDTIAPATTISHSPGSSTVSLSATDATSGVQATYYHLDSDPWTKYTGSFTLPGTGSHVIWYYSQDNAGNNEAIKTLKVHYLTVNTDPAGIATISGTGWYDHGTTATTGTAPTTVTSGGIVYTFSTWKKDGTPVGGNPISVLMDAPHTATAVYLTVSFKIWTDKTVYKIGETMKVYVRVKNPGAALPVRALIYLKLPDGTLYGPLLDMTTTIPSGYDSGDVLWKSFTIPSAPLGNYQWIAQLKNPTTGALISQSTWEWSLTAASMETPVTNVIIRAKLAKLE